VHRVLATRARAGSRPGARQDGFRVALAIEGGGMRGTISAGMALALDELGLVTAFDAVYGASAGAITAAWLLSRPQGLRGWTEPAYARAFIRRSGLLRGRPVADVRSLIEELYQTTFPMDFAAVLASPIEFHPLATDAVTGQSTDLRPLIGTPAELRLALRASAALPLLAGPPVELGGRRFYDAGLSESVPYRTALAQGATHVLVMRSRRDPLTAPDGQAPDSQAPDVQAPDSQAPDAPVPPRSARLIARTAPSRSARLIARTTLRRESPALRATFLARDARRAEDDRRLAAYQTAPANSASPSPASPSPASPSPASPSPASPSPASAGPASPSSASAPAGPPWVFSIRPPVGSPEVSRLATDGRLLEAAFEAGRTATHAALAPLTFFHPSSPLPTCRPAFLSPSRP
jgi:predicted acylesterase/phospholipase RssA